MVLVDAMLNDKPAFLLLDTGGNNTIVTAETEELDEFNGFVRDAVPATDSSEAKETELEVLNEPRGDGMRLTSELSHALLERHGCYVTEVCDKCGQILGPVRFTRRGEAGVWCSRECRDGAEAHTPGTCKGCGARLPEGKRRGSLYCDDACRKLSTRSRTDELSRTNGPVYAGFYTDFEPPAIPP